MCVGVWVAVVILLVAFPAVRFHFQRVPSVESQQNERANAEVEKEFTYHLTVGVS
jgi:hypothetical protein